jgi:hypothetical protein
VRVRRSEPVMNLNLTTSNRSGWSSPKFDQLAEPEPWSGSRLEKLGPKTERNRTTAALATSSLLILISSAADSSSNNIPLADPIPPASLRIQVANANDQPMVPQSKSSHTLEHGMEPEPVEFKGVKGVDEIGGEAESHFDVPNFSVYDARHSSTHSPNLA